MYPPSLQVATDIAEAERRQAGGGEVPELIGNVKDAVVNFTQVKDFTTFLAEWAIIDGSYVLHFFPPRERYVHTGNGRYQVHGEFLVKWQRQFPLILDPVAQEYFQATAPRLQATYTAEMFSWWFKAAGMAERFDPSGFISKFLETLDAALDAASFLNP
jgi:hypothetical protein